MVAKLKEIRRVISSEELVAEIDEAMKDPLFRRAVKELAKRIT